MNDDFISSSMDTGMSVPPDEGGAPGGGAVGGGGDAPSMVSMRGPETYQGHALKSRFAYVIRQQPRPISPAAGAEGDQQSATAWLGCAPPKGANGNQILIHGSPDVTLVKRHQRLRAA